ncbi:Tfp pilus assembly protein FimT/FimU [Acinetobacter sp. YH12039]|uniref:pilus assembly FimT family protein n=1 Tax=Acinetobacter sp. YH12039 TaxID=2601047 RepID=UPI0015D3B9D8|nr:prepilin-type N-terminal cleavage/methylation domain-containing protein [Acinetobacter sp. YH12039]
MQKNNGFTLIELMVIIAILAIVASVAAPSFQSIIQNNELKQGSHKLLIALNDAKNNARLTRQVSVLKLDSSYSVPATAKSFDVSAGLGTNLELEKDVKAISFLANGQIQTEEAEYPICIAVKHSKSLKVESLTISQLGLVTQAKTSC